MDTISPSLKLNKQVIDEAREIIDKRIARLESELSASKSERNALAPINLLPSNVLGHIFKHLCRSCWVNPGYITPSSTKKPVIRWLVVTHVCQIWRNIALRQPDLWSIIPLHNPHCLSEFLARSRRAGLFVEIHSQNRYWNVDLVPKEHARIRRFELEGPVSQDIKRYLGLPAPQLELFSFRPESSYHFHLPSNLFANTTPRLQHIYLINCTFNWDLGIFQTNIVTLSIISPTSGTTIKAIGDLVATMPKLQTLILHGVLHPEEQSRINHMASRAINLPSLMHLELHTETFCQLLSLVSRLTVPSQTVMDLRYKKGSDIAFFEAFKIVQRARKESPLDNIRAVQVSTTDFGAYTEERPNGTPFLYLHCDEVVSDLGQCLPSALDLSSNSLESFTATDIPITEKMWSRLEGPLWGVRHVATVGSSGSTLVQYLTSNYDETCPAAARDEGENSRGTIWFGPNAPKQVWDEEDIAFTNLLDLNMTKMVYPESQEEHDKVLYMFYHRKKFRCGFGNVEFVKCKNLTRHKAAELGLHARNMRCEEERSDNELQLYRSRYPWLVFV